MGYSPNLPIDQQDIDDLDFITDSDVIDGFFGDDDEDLSDMLDD